MRGPQAGQKVRLSSFPRSADLILSCLFGHNVIMANSHHINSRWHERTFAPTFLRSVYMHSISQSGCSCPWLHARGGGQEVTGPRQRLGPSDSVRLERCLPCGTGALKSNQAVSAFNPPRPRRRRQPLVSRPTTRPQLPHFCALDFKGKSFLSSC